MTRIVTLAFGAALLAGPALAQTAPATLPAPQPAVTAPAAPAAAAVPEGPVKPIRAGRDGRCNRMKLTS